MSQGGVSKIIYYLCRSEMSEIKEKFTRDKISIIGENLYDLERA